MVIKAPHGSHEHDFSLGPAGAWNLLFSSFWELLRILRPGMPSHLQEWGVWMQNSRPSTWWGTRVLLQIQWFESHLDLGVLQEGQTLIIASFRPPLHTSPIKNIQESKIYELSSGHVVLFSTCSIPLCFVITSQEEHPSEKPLCLVGLCCQWAFVLLCHAHLPATRRKWPAGAVMMRTSACPRTRQKNLN